MKKEDVSGIQFPRAAGGGRSSTQVGRRVLSAALHAVDPGLAARVAADRRWRTGYPTHIRALVRQGSGDEALALSSANAGLDAAWDAICWVDQDGERPLREAWANVRQPLLHGMRISGSGGSRPRPLAVPYRGQLLEGDALRRQADDWLAGHRIEPGAAAAIHRCVDNPGWFDLSDRTLVLLGAGAEVGPLSHLAHWRANIVAVDVARGALWKPLVATVAEGNATLHFPFSGAPADGGAADVERAGVDLLREAPRIADWLLSLGRPLDLLGLAYADGERHLRVAMAMDWIVRAALDGDPASTVAWLATPTDVFVMPEATAHASRAAYARRSLLPRLLGPLFGVAGIEAFRPNVEERGRDAARGGHALADSLVIQQGPNYALAKRLQQWRAQEARGRGRRVSLNIAPATTTASVTSNPVLAAAYAGAHRFGVEAFAPETTRALMAALWVHDLRCEHAPGNPARGLAHPWMLFGEQACHGGFWSCAYLPRTALPFAAALGWRARGRA